MNSRFVATPDSNMQQSGIIPNRTKSKSTAKQASEDQIKKIKKFSAVIDQFCEKNGIEKKLFF